MSHNLRQESHKYVQRTVLINISTYETLYVSYVCGLDDELYFLYLETQEHWANIASAVEIWELNVYLS